MKSSKVTPKTTAPREKNTYNNAPTICPAQVFAEFPPDLDLLSRGSGRVALLPLSMACRPRGRGWTAAQLDAARLGVRDPKYLG